MDTIGIVTAPTTPHVPSHLSASSVAEYVRCPQRWYWKRVMGVADTPSPLMRFGTAVHRAIEQHHAGAQDPREAFCEEWLLAVRDLEADGTPVDAANLREKGLALVSLYRADPNPDGEPEAGWRVTLPLLGVPLVGYFDLAGTDWLAEHKCSLWPWKEGRVGKEIQGGLYLAAFPFARGRLATHIDYTILSINPQPALTRIRLETDAMRCYMALEAARQALAGMRGGHWEARCKPEQCSYPEMCQREGTE